MLYAIQDQVIFDRLIIAGDFNYSLLRSHTLKYATSTGWLNLMEAYFYNSMHMNELSEIPTFQRNRCTTVVSSVIDYIYVGQNIRHQLCDNSLTRLHSDWSDHSILHISFSVGCSPTGPGLWRANPAYASHSALLSKIESKVKKLMAAFSQQPSLPPEEQWDKVKVEVQQVIRNYGYKYVNWRRTTIKRLEQKQNRILRGKPPLAVRLQLIGPLDAKLGQLQQQLAEIDALKAGIRWREQGEKSAGFLKRLHQQRTVQQYMNSVRRLDDDRHAAVTIEAEMPDRNNTSDPALMREIVRQYYQQLYSSDPVEDSNIDDYLSTITFAQTVSREDNDDLTKSITIDDLIEQAKRSPHQSSPGNDGLGYQYLQNLFSLPSLQPLLVTVYNRTLQEGISPPSWKDIRVRLLPKKGDLADLKNWRPISLINCDAKIFTRILNKRMANVANKIIQPAQTGFMQGRFIGDNGLMLHLLLQQARYFNYTGIGLLLDQEKAYDRVHPRYLIKVLTAFGFNSCFTRCIDALFFW